MSLRITAFEYTERFKREFKGLSPDQQAAAAKALKELQGCPIPRGLRHHTLRDTRPKIHKIDIASNHSYQITFEVNGEVAKLLRVAAHKEIDRAAR